ncbi:GNAT family N-acetyltransferase [Leptotrichia sp. OH3620_COT-345]|uniref:GNAT family N-acetyltransferase n=1 Tax=Leptotrichia sp. OH3620_COT-345 TaxID=2491048 RepID=UPI000F64BEF5|nr:GNAT family N-acetyltransferase [Leptotrichia sp. OH3620_COT-345]RRD40724.1 GNAT family N-acetyltransferase [Leptotrichia sp. OH3620_COT-345]
MKIRRALNKDIPQINELLYQVHKVHSDKRPDIFKQGAKKYNERELELILKNDKKPVFVALNDEETVIGYVFCIFQEYKSSSLNNVKTLYIDDLCVNEKVRGQKTGQKLYEYILEYAKENKCYNLTLNVWACNEQALKFYEKCGLKVQKIGMEKILN